jgi:F0F1-type ATP synthase membrane subunit b/b'
MDWLRIIQILALIIATGVALGAGVGGFYYAFKSKSTKLLKERVDELKADVDKCESQHKETKAQMKLFEGKLEAYKEIPLQHIAVSLGKLAESNQLILKELKGIDTASVTVETKVKK